MAKPTDLDGLAQRYLDLWQDQLADMAADRDVAEIMARTVELMSSGTAALAALARSGPERRTKGGGAGPEHDDRDATGDRAGNGAGTEAAAPAPGAAGPGLDDLARRLAALEERVASLEGGDGGPRPGPEKRPRKRRS